MSGGGFGGAVVAVLAADQIARVSAALQANYQPPDGSAISIMIERAGGMTAGMNA